MSSDSSSNSYAVFFDIEATKSGGITAVKVKDSMVAGSDLEACLAGVLERMEVPARPDVSPESRGMVGIAQALAGPISLLPIVLVAGGVTILVGVTIYVATEAEKERERCKQVKADCIADCTAGFVPSGQADGMPYHECLRKCLEAQNCWKIFDKISPGY